MYLFIWLLSLCIIILISIHVVVVIFYLFLFPSSISLNGYINICLSIPCWWTFGLFPALTITDKAKMNIHIQVFMRTYTFISLGNTPNNRMFDHVLDTLLKFEATAKLFLKVLVKILRSHQCRMRVPVTPHPS